MDSLVFYSRRVDEINDEVVAHDKECNRLAKEAIRLYNEILLVLPVEAKKLIALYDEITGAKSARSEVIIYQKGLHDGKILTDTIPTPNRQTDIKPVKNSR